MRNLHYLILLIDSPNKEKCLQLIEDNSKRFNEADGSSHNHQSWRGGYLDHIDEY